ncbi:alpha/beta fold hydrolase [Paraburkholderia lycopersici]|uniref:Pimeloyl-ACP methyl ester carboxylesterase n=1 Tax=Paraburkholderia lycopersici TaxID=416944 RepID=A0A1G6LXB9_9BURK|nr:alpha/beta hydrolase [Paraburkholderia lycopersici]SDC47913.1 Pimeloyl-ACP methyl ester carboxylesterase [Paraburkholderia lycopersici]
MPYLSIEKSQIYYEVHGEGAPVVLLHGVGGNHASWFYQIEAWSQRFRMIALDARGFGNSTDAEGKGRSAFTSDLEALLNHLGLDRVAIVAQSMGGGTAVDFTCKHPERVTALVLADTLVWLDPTEEMAEPFKKVQEATATLSQSERVLGSTFRTAEPALSELYLRIASFNQYTFKTLVGTQQRYRPVEVAQSGVPTCFVVGNEDVLFPPELMRKAWESVPGAEWVQLPRAGHSAYFEAPVVFNNEVGAWLDGRVARE